MGFLKGLGIGGGAGEGAMAPAGANGMAVKMGRLVGRRPEEVGNFAHRLGTGMNMIAAGGGADPGYSGVAPQEAVPMNNVLQQFDPKMMGLFLRNFQGGRF